MYCGRGGSWRTGRGGDPAGVVGDFGPGEPLAGGLMIEAVIGWFTFVRARAGCICAVHAYQLKKLSAGLRFSGTAPSCASPGATIWRLNRSNCVAISEWFESDSGTPEFTAEDTAASSLG